MFAIREVKMIKIQTQVTAFKEEINAARREAKRGETKTVEGQINGINYVVTIKKLGGLGSRKLK
ncbi:MAG: hypothetical protein LBH08_03315 [Puniceicoccales bacterium]|jgi:hypothetical protein|nr:hypothetical protein [Puniceicoccales bacterium]